MGLSVAREIAYDTYVQVMQHGRRPEDVMDEAFKNSKKPLKRLDKNFIKELVFGSLRWHSKLFWILQNTSRRDLDKSSGAIQAALVVGTYQIYYMDRVPDRAAVNESVEYVRSKGQSSACTFVNGILRQISRRAQYFTKPDKEKQPVEYLSLQFAHPEWIVKRWHDRFKFDRMTTLLANNNLPAPFSIRINTLKVKIEESHELQQKLLKNEKTHSERRPLRTCLRCKEFPNLEPGSFFDQGYYTIQDEAAQLIGYLVAPEEGETIIDTCCGPGGKLGHLYELAGGNLNLIGIDKGADRLEKTRETLERLGHTGVELIKTSFISWESDIKADRILIDAPCSGLGVLRRHPEGKWQKDRQIIGQMVGIQRELISAAFERLKPGGELVFSVCSFELEETLDQLNWALKKYADQVVQISPVSRIPDFYKKYVTRENVLLIYTGNQDEMDGFGAFILRKKA